MVEDVSEFPVEPAAEGLGLTLRSTTRLPSSSSSLSLSALSTLVGGTRKEEGKFCRKKRSGS